MRTLTLEAAARAGLYPTMSVVQPPEKEVGGHLSGRSATVTVNPHSRLTAFAALASSQKTRAGY
ncbi:MAG: hypothetical protein ACTTI9_08830, partial [Schaalia odontolytica]